MKKLLVILFALLLLLSACNPASTPSSPTPEPTPEPTPAPQELLSQALAIDGEQAEQIVSVIEGLGVDGIYAVTRADDVDYMLRVQSRIDPLLVKLDESNEVETIEFALTGEPLYADGEAVVQLLSVEQEKRPMERVDEIMYDYLLFPSSAIYPPREEWNIVSIGEEICLTTYVDCENFFEEIERKQLYIVLKKSNPVSILIDGQEKLNQ